MLACGSSMPRRLAAPLRLSALPKPMIREFWANGGHSELPVIGGEPAIFMPELWTGATRLQESAYPASIDPLSAGAAPFPKQRIVRKSRSIFQHDALQDRRTSHLNGRMARQCFDPG